MKNINIIVTIVILTLIAILIFCCENLFRNSKHYEPTFTVDTSNRKILTLSVPATDYDEIIDK